MVDEIPAQQEVKQFAFMIVLDSSDDQGQGKARCFLEIERLEARTLHDDLKPSESVYNFEKFADTILKDTDWERLEIRGAGIFSMERQGGELMLKLQGYSGLFGPPEAQECEKLLRESKFLLWLLEEDYKIDSKSIEKYTVTTREMTVAHWLSQEMRDHKARIYNEIEGPAWK